MEKVYYVDYKGMIDPGRTAREHVGVLSIPVKNRILLLRPGLQRIAAALWESVREHGQIGYDQASKSYKGELVKQPFGPWVRKLFGVLAALKGLRGGALDYFGRNAERRMEVALIKQYRDCIDELLQGLSADKLALAAQIARIPEDIRGFGHVKERHLKAARAKWDDLMAQWRGGGARKRA